MVKTNLAWWGIFLTQCSARNGRSLYAQSSPYDGARFGKGRFVPLRWHGGWLCRPDLVGVGAGPGADHVLDGVLEAGGAGGFEKVFEEGKRLLVHEGFVLGMTQWAAAGIGVDTGRGRG